MSYTRVQAPAGGATSNSTTSLQLAFASTVTAGTLLVATVQGSVDPSGVSDNVNGAWSSARAADVVNTSNFCETFYFVNSASGTITVTAAFGSAARCSIQIAEYSGGPTSSIIDGTPTGNTGFGTTLSTGNVTTTIANALIITNSVCESTAGIPFGQGTNFTEVTESATGNSVVAGGQLQERLNVAVGSYAGAATLAGTTNWAMQTVAFKGLITAAITGTATASIVESDIVSGGKTIIATVSGDTYVPASAISDIQHVTFALLGTTDSTTLNITLPTVTAGDIMIVEYTHRSTGTGTFGGTGGSDWNFHTTKLYSADTFSVHIYWKRCDGSESGDALAVSGLTNSCAGCVNLYRNCAASGTPIEALTAESNISGNETHAEITTTVDKAFVVLTVANSPDVNVSSQTCTSPGALSERAERLNTTGTDTSISHASAVKATAGATGALTWAQTDGASGSLAYAIKPNVTTPFDSARQAFIDGFDSAQAEGTGWDAEVKAKAAVTEVVRTSDTVVTWTIAAQAGYDITAQETITGTIPASIMAGGVAVVATPTFTIDTGGGAPNKRRYTQTLLGVG